MAIKTSICIAAVLVIDLLLVLPVPAKRIALLRSNDDPEDSMVMKLNSINGEMARKMRLLMRRADTLEVAGSSLPDCSHACGSCSPCRLVMVSFVCASLAEAETCPMSYKCMCNSKSYPVP
ncbi:hypothetical protein AAG906_027081 [Vitis piasezkii]